MRVGLLFTALLLVVVLLVSPTRALSGVNCYGDHPLGIDRDTASPRFLTGAGPRFVKGDPAVNNQWLASRTMPANLTVAFFGDQFTHSAARAVLNLVKLEGAELVIHSGDFDYQNDPTLWQGMLDEILGPYYPYFAAGGNHDMLAWRKTDGTLSYEKVLFDKLQRIGSDISCRGEVGLNMVCSYKGLTFVTSSFGATYPQCTDYCSGAPHAYGHASFIHRAFDTYPSMWKVCAWHKNNRLMQIGNKITEVGLGFYDICREHGAIIATGHEHSYARTYEIEDFRDLESAFNATDIYLNKGHTFAFCNGLGGLDIRPWTDPLQNNPWWASVWASNNHAQYASLFCKFNYNGQLDLAYCYLKDIDGRIMDSFYLHNQMTEPPPMATDATKVEVCKNDAFEVELQVKSAANAVSERISTGAVDCADIRVRFGEDYLTGLRFENVPFDLASQITDAYLEITSDKDSELYSGITSALHIFGELTPASAAFGCNPTSVSPRPVTTAEVVWGTGPWTMGGIYRSPDISSVLKEVISQPGWQLGNPISLIINGTGLRLPMSYAGDRCQAPTLVINGGTQKCIQHQFYQNSPVSPPVAVPVAAPVAAPVAPPVKTPVAAPVSPPKAPAAPPKAPVAAPVAPKAPVPMADSLRPIVPQGLIPLSTDRSAASSITTSISFIILSVALLLAL